MRRASAVPRSLPLALIIDADADTREMYATFLLSNGWHIELAPDGPTGLATALSVRPDVIMAESNLPSMDGFALCQVLRSDPATRGTPILLLNATARQEDVDHARHAGSDLVLTKPILPATLLEALTRLWKQSAAPSPRPRKPGASNQDGRRRQTRRERQLWAEQRGSTTAPPEPPPVLRCGRCDRVLEYQHSHIGGVSAQHPEQWDYFRCAGCGTDYQYRVRTKRVRSLR
jgi:CheY-like chemotaxis protein